MRKDEELSQQLKVMMGKAKDSLEVAKQLHKQNHYNAEADVGDAEAIICAIGEYLQKEGYLDV